jgi:glyoxylase-like metal-dependent hydrolase (beta-lactamase superfamily II)/rhodanese-related sulfurtransferase
MQEPELQVADLKQRLQQGEDLMILDVRNREDFAAWKIEGRRAVPVLNVPYFDILEGGGKDDVVESVKEYVPRALADKLPREKPIVAVCNRGNTSQHITAGLRDLGYNATSLVGGMQGWGQLYCFTPIVESEALSLWQVSRPARGCLSYVVASQGACAVVDPLRHTAKYLEFVRQRGLEIEFVVDTHAHADHISGAPQLARELDVPYYLHPYDGIHPIDVLPARVEFEYLREGKRLKFGSATLRVLHVPGHTLGNVALLLDDKYLLSGDSIFLRSIARPDLGGQGKAWAALHYRSLRKLMELPQNVVVLPGHFAAPAEADDAGRFAATLADIEQHNQDLRAAMGTEKEFVQHILASLPQFPPQYVDIKRVNAGLMEPDEAAAAELELGKNVCALAKSGVEA